MIITFRMFIINSFHLHFLVVIKCYTCKFIYIKVPINAKTLKAKRCKYIDLIRGSQTSMNRQQIKIITSRTRKIRK